MKAWLITACGCRRKISVAPGLRRVVVPVPVTEYRWASGEVPPRPELRTREFDYAGHTANGTWVFQEIVR